MILLTGNSRLGRHDRSPVAASSPHPACALLLPALPSDPCPPCTPKGRLCCGSRLRKGEVFDYVGRNQHLQDLKGPRTASPARAHAGRPRPALDHKSIGRYGGKALLKVLLTERRFAASWNSDQNLRKRPSMTYPPRGGGGLSGGGFVVGAAAARGLARVLSVSPPPENLKNNWHLGAAIAIPVRMNTIVGVPGSALAGCGIPRSASKCFGVLREVHTWSFCPRELACTQPISLPFSAFPSESLGSHLCSPLPLPRPQP